MKRILSLFLAVLLLIATASAQTMTEELGLNRNAKPAST